jgi:hypothetical protein
MVSQFTATAKIESARYLLPVEDFRKRVGQSCPKVGFVSVSSPFNTRSMIAALLPDLPAGNSLPTLVFRSMEEALYTTAVFNSFVFDALIRLRITGNNLSYHLLADLPFPSPARKKELEDLIVFSSALLSFDSLYFKEEARALCGAHRFGEALSAAFFSSALAGNQAYRLRLRLWLELLVCELYDLNPGQVAYILRDCQFSQELLSRRRRLGADSLRAVTAKEVSNREQDYEPGQRTFFRVDKTLPPHLRLSNMVNLAYQALKSGPLDYFLDLSESLAQGDYSLSLPGFLEVLIEERFSKCSLHLSTS